MHVILRPLVRYADFSGRASRAEYWLFGLAQSVLLLFLLIMAVMAFAGLRENASQALGGFLLSLALIGVVALGLFIPNLALLARRMHDINMSAWWMGLLVPNYLAQVSNIMGVSKIFQATALGASQDMINNAVMSSMATTGLLTTVAMVCGLALFIIVLIPGNKGPNRFGGDPKDGPGLSPRSVVHAFDEDRIDAAIASLKAEKPHVPVFDFGPGSNDKPMMAPRQAPVMQTQPNHTPLGQAPAKPTFGRRR
jgi:uncharacterized membrane protein YhaH (DUF805 family)